jgi:hypothetical protein
MGAAAAGGQADTESLLGRHQPVLRYDSQEAYFSDSAATWTDNPGNVLVRADGTLLAAAKPSGGVARLGLSFLGHSRYANGLPVLKGDTISDPSRNYVAQAAALHPKYGNVTYGHARADAGGALWLQYWRWHFYNDFAIAGAWLHGGLHEGDWEMIQLRLGADGAPDRAAYAQHRGAEARAWSDVATDASAQRPIVYVARGSHASYYEPGAHWTGAWFDQADGRRPSPGELLHVVADDRPAWITWPGFWGDTRPVSGPISSRSPTGPASHAQWRDPSVLLRVAARQAAAPAPPAPEVPPPPQVTATRDGTRLDVAYDLGAHLRGPATVTTIVVTVNSKDDRIPPRSWALAISGARGRVSPPVELGPEQHYDINVSATTAKGVASNAVEILLPPAS